MFNRDISYVTPTKDVNSENTNLPVSEVQGNVEHIANYLNGNKALLPGIWGNLWDFDNLGKRVSRNGGAIDTFKKTNTWKSLTNFRRTNDEEIFFDDVAERMIYEGRSSNTTDREKWIEREIYIPEPLRNQQLVFALKASGSSIQYEWEEGTAEYETVGVQILGGKEDINEFRTVGPFENFDYYVNESYTPKMLTAYVPFYASNTTQSVKIKVFRTVNDGWLHIDKVFVGGLALPFDNEIETYELGLNDINEFYNFEGDGYTKVISNNVLGHKVNDDYDGRINNDLVKFEDMYKLVKEAIEAGTSGSSFDPTPTIAFLENQIPTNSIPDPTIYPDLFNYDGN